MIDGATQVITSQRSGFYAAQYPGINEDRLERHTSTLRAIMRIWPSFGDRFQANISSRQSTGPLLISFMLTSSRSRNESSYGYRTRCVREVFRNSLTFD